MRAGAEDLQKKEKNKKEKLFASIS